MSKRWIWREGWDTSKQAACYNDNAKKTVFIAWTNFRDFQLHRIC